MSSRLSLDQLESLTRSGQFADVVRALQNLNTKKIARVEAARFANLANRVDFSQLAFRILNPILRGSKGLAVLPSDSEKCEYGEALRRMGLLGEAMQYFLEVNTNQFPVALLRMAFCLFNQWKYDEAIPLLKAYVEKVEHDEYARRIGLLNLAAAYVAERLDEEALSVLEPLLSETRAANNHLLYSNCLELKTQVLIRLKDLTAAEQTMAEASAVVTDSKTRYARYMRKWHAIALSLKNNEAAPDLLLCREEALKSAEWETVRDCDLYIAHFTHNRELLEFLYFGTPYASFRRRILDLTGEVPSRRDFIWRFGAQREPEVIVDLSSGSTQAGESLVAGQVQHRLLILICRDFYRPLSNGIAFSNLYPGEHFAQEGSTNRVVQSVRRLRGWLHDLSPGIQIESVEGGYRLSGDGSFAIRIPREPLPLESRPLEWNSVKLGLNEKVFSKRDIMQSHNCSDSAAKRLLNWAVETGHAEPIAWGAGAKYRLTG